jgi:uncharacterized protein (DUF2236 family)
MTMAPRNHSNSQYYFPPGESIARRVHEERVVGVLYGPRAVILGALEPLTYAATMQSTRSKNYPFRRLARTAKIHEVVLLGTREEADEALESVRRLHDRVAGTLDQPAGVHPAGTPYSALDQELMLWTLAVIADSARAIYEALVQELSEAEREGLWQDYLFFGELFGMSRAAMPASYAEFNAWFGSRFEVPDLQPTPHAVATAPVLASEQPGSLLGRPILHFNNLMIKGTLPDRIRSTFEIRWTTLHQVAFRWSASSTAASVVYFQEGSGGDATTSPWMRSFEQRKDAEARPSSRWAEPAGSAAAGVVAAR